MVHSIVTAGMSRTPSIRRARGAASMLITGLIALSAGLASAQADTPTWRERLKAARASAVPAAPWTTPGTHRVTLPHGGLERHALVHVPAGFRPKAPTALVFAFHGGGGDAAYMADDDRYGLIALAERERFVLVLPSGYSRFPRGKLATWNAGDCCGDARDRQIDDVGFVRALLTHLGQLLVIDRGRVFAMGMSNGAMMSYRLACEMSDTFRAIAAVAGTEAVASCQPSRPVGILHIHARDDTHVLFNGGAGPDAFGDASKVMDFVSVPTTVSRWVTRQQCAPTPRRTLDVPGAFCDTYSGCADGAEVRLCVTASGGHSWPGAPGSRLGRKPPPSQVISAHEQAWSFFQSQAARPR